MGENGAGDQQEIRRLREALEKIQDRSRRSQESYRPGRNFATPLAEEWHHGFVTALAEVSLVAMEALDPEGWEEHRATMDLVSLGTDREWFEKTGCCGHCGNTGSDCVCTDDDPCGCGPHEPRTWPVVCYACKGSGVQDPLRKNFLAPQGRSGV